MRKPGQIIRQEPADWTVIAPTDEARRRKESSNGKRYLYLLDATRSTGWIVSTPEEVFAETEASFSLPGSLNVWEIK